MILLVTHKYPPSTGGMERQSYELYHNIRTETDTVILKYDNQGSKLLWLLKLYFLIKSTIKKHPEIRLIHLNDIALSTLYPRLFKLGIPIVATAHGLDVSFPIPYYQKRLTRSIQKLSGIICVSDSTRQLCLQRGAHASKCIMIYNGVDHQWASLLDSEKISYGSAQISSTVYNKRTILMVGRAVKRKGFSWFIKNVVPLLPSDVNYILISPRRNPSKIEHKIRKHLNPKHTHLLNLFLGHPDDEAEINVQVEKLGLKNRFHRLKRATNSDLKFWYKKSDLFVMPNIPVEGDHEGFGLVALEAVMSGCKTIVAKQDGIPSAIKHTLNGWQVSSSDAFEWQKILTEKLHQPFDESHRRYTKANYSWKLMADQYCKFFDQVLTIQSKDLPIQEWAHAMTI